MGTPECVLTNGRLVLPDEVVAGGMKLAGGTIAAIDPGPTSLPAALDLEGDFLIPGLIDLHTDHLEKHFQPRRGIQWDQVHAAISHDVQIIGSGITTVYDSITIGAAAGWIARAELIEPMLAGLREAQANDMLKAEHRIHLRCEVTHPDIVALFEHHARTVDVQVMSLMDHAPGDRQIPDVEHYKQIFLEIFGGDRARLDAHVDGLIEASRTLGPGNRRQLAEAASRLGIVLASHDDASAAHIAEAAALGCTVTEFPTTVDAARAGRAAGLAVLMGSPNLIRGGSSAGNVAAADLARAGLLDLLSSDYIPGSLLVAAFRLTGAAFGFSLPAAIRTATAAPAAAVGLSDRGRIEVGRRADLVRVRDLGGRPLVRAVWRAGVRVL